MTGRELKRLRQLVDEAQAEKNRPWAPGEVVSDRVSFRVLRAEPNDQHP
jgi:hypothetical protein